MSDIFLVSIFATTISEPYSDISFAGTAGFQDT